MTLNVLFLILHYTYIIGSHVGTLNMLLSCILSININYIL